MDAPERTQAGLPFDAEVTLQNKGPARDVDLFAALYAPGGAACGPATDPSFRAFTHLVQVRVRLDAGATHVERAWRQQYDAADVPRAPSTMEWCVFVGEDRAGRIEYFDHQAIPLATRGANARPVASFTWSPASPAALDDARFVADASDADGDPLSYRWDFGRFDAGGRATGEGEEAAHAFYPEGRYVVTLTVTDGLEETTVANEVTVGPEEPPASRGVPHPAALTLLALVLAAARRR